MVRFSKACLLLAPLLSKVLALPTEAVEEDVKIEIVEASGPFVPAVAPEWIEVDYPLATSEDGLEESDKAAADLDDAVLVEVSYEWESEEVPELTPEQIYQFAVEELEIIQMQVHQLKDLIREKKRIISEFETVGSLGDCGSISCLASTVYKKAKSAAHSAVDAMSGKGHGWPHWPHWPHPHHNGTHGNCTRPFPGHPHGNHSHPHPPHHGPPHWRHPPPFCHCPPHHGPPGRRPGPPHHGPPDRRPGDGGDGPGGPPHHGPGKRPSPPDGPDGHGPPHHGPPFRRPGDAPGDRPAPPGRPEPPRRPEPPQRPLPPNLPEAPLEPERPDEPGHPSRPDEPSPPFPPHPWDHRPMHHSPLHLLPHIFILILIIFFTRRCVRARRARRAKMLSEKFDETPRRRCPFSFRRAQLAEHAPLESVTAPVTLTSENISTEIAQLRSAAELVEDIIAAEEGRSRRPRAPSAGSIKSLASRTSSLPEYSSDMGEDLPAYEVGEENVAVVDGWRYERETVVGHGVSIGGAVEIGGRRSVDVRSAVEKE